MKGEGRDGKGGQGIGRKAEKYKGGQRRRGRNEDEIG
jgi:hypothetical protein